MIMYFAFYASSPEPLILATTFFINSSLNLYLFLYTMYARMTPIVGTIHISTRIEFCVASDCTAFGTYPVSSSTNPIASEVNAAVSQEHAKSLEERLEKDLSELERRVLYLHLMGTDYKTIAKLLDRSPKTIDNALQRIKGKMQRILEKEK